MANKTVIENYAEHLCEIYGTAHEENLEWTTWLVNEAETQLGNEVTEIVYYAYKTLITVGGKKYWCKFGDNDKEVNFEEWTVVRQVGETVTGLYYNCMDKEQYCKETGIDMGGYLQEAVEIEELTGRTVVGKAIIKPGCRGAGKLTYNELTILDDGTTGCIVGDKWHTVDIKANVRY